MFKIFYDRYLMFDLINKFNYLSFLKIPKIKKIILTFDFKNFNVLFLNLLLLELVCQKKNNVFIKMKKQFLLFKIKKGIMICCQVVLKTLGMEKFFTILIVEVLPFMFKFNDFNIFCFYITNLFLFKKLEKLLNFFNVLTKIQVLIVTNINVFNKNQYQYINHNLNIFNN